MKIHQEAGGFPSELFGQGFSGAKRTRQRAHEDSALQVDHRQPLSVLLEEGPAPTRGPLRIVCRAQHPFGPGKIGQEFPFPDMVACGEKIEPQLEELFRDLLG